MIPCVRFKEGVRLDPLTPTLARTLCGLDMTARMQGIDITVTCGREDHKAGDPHTLGHALDVRVSDMTPEKILASFHYLKSVLGDPFTVIYEVPATPVNGALKNIAFINQDATAPHLHVQLRRFLTTYPPQDSTSQDGETSPTKAA